MNRIRRRRKVNFGAVGRKVRLFGDAAQERLHRQAMAAVEAAVQARRTTNCRSARRTLEEAETYYGEAVLDATSARLTLDTRQALAYAKREVTKSRERLAFKCGRPREDDE